MQRRESNDTARAGVLLRRLRREDGSGLVEFAIVFILYMTMILGVMDFARALYVYHFVSHVAREATRYAAVNGSDLYVTDGSCTAAATQQNDRSVRSGFHAAGHRFEQDHDDSNMAGKWYDSLHDHG